MKYKLKSGNILAVVQHEYPENPRHDSNLGKMICFHDRYNLGDKHNYDPDCYTSWEEAISDISKEERSLVELPLYLYDHTGITISTEPFSCPWDSGRVGFIMVTEKALRENFQLTADEPITVKHIDAAMRILKYEVEVYNKYITGDVYGFKVYDSEGQMIDSCYGFYGDDPKENGMMEYVDDEIIEKLGEAVV